MDVAKFERNAVCHLAKEIKDREDAAGGALGVATNGRVKPKFRTPFEIMTEALTRLGMPTDDNSIYRYVRYWALDAKIINDTVTEIRAATQSETA